MLQISSLVTPQTGFLWSALHDSWPPLCAAVLVACAPRNGVIHHRSRGVPGDGLRGKGSSQLTGEYQLRVGCACFPGRGRTGRRAVLLTVPRRRGAWRADGFSSGRSIRQQRLLQSSTGMQEGKQSNFGTHHNSSL